MSVTTLSQAAQTLPRPRFHTAANDIRVMLQREYREFADAYRHAAEDLRAGRPYRFPGGRFPPALPYQPRPDPGPLSPTLQPS